MTHSLARMIPALALFVSLSAQASRPGPKPEESRRPTTREAVVQAPPTSLDKLSLMRPETVRTPSELAVVWRAVEALQAAPADASGSREVSPQVRDRLSGDMANFLRFGSSSLTPYEAFAASNIFAGRQDFPSVGDVRISRQDPRALRLGDRVAFGRIGDATQGIVVAVNGDSFGGVLVLWATHHGEIKRSMVSMRDVNTRVTGALMDGHPL